MGNNTIAFNIITFWFLFNISIAIVLALVPSLKYYEDNPAGLMYNSTSLSEFNSDVREAVKPSSIIQDAADQIARVFDMITLGLLSKITTIFNNSIWGGITAFESIYQTFAGGSGEDFRIVFFGALKTITSFAYGIGVVNLFTGKNPIENQE